MESGNGALDNKRCALHEALSIGEARIGIELARLRASPSGLIGQPFYDWFIAADCFSVGRFSGLPFPNRPVGNVEP